MRRGLPWKAYVVDFNEEIVAEKAKIASQMTIVVLTVADSDEFLVSLSSYSR